MLELRKKGNSFSYMLANDFGRTNSNSRARGPFKPKPSSKGTSSYQLRQFAEATLGSGSLRKAVKLPDGEDLNEWLAVNGTSHPPCGIMFGRISSDAFMQL